VAASAWVDASRCHAEACGLRQAGICCAPSASPEPGDSLAQGDDAIAASLW